MNLANVYIKQVLEDDERGNMRDALRKDEVIIPTLLKILASRTDKCKPNLNNLKSSSYPYVRAAKDGAQIELEWLIELLTLNKE
jgi:hypothetical protein